MLSPQARGQTSDAGRAPRDPNGKAPDAKQPSSAAKTGKKPAVENPIAVFDRGDYEKAEELFAAEREKHPQDFVPLYNLACCRSMRGDADGAVAYLADAIEKGFCDVYLLRRDATLNGARKSPKFKALLDHWDELLVARRDANVKQAQIIFAGDKYVERQDDALRLCYRSAFNEKAFGESRAELTRIAAFADSELFKGVLDPKLAHDDAWVVVALPTRPDFLRWAVSVYGADVISGGNSTIGGAYEHDAKRLVSMDLGASLRHEFFHVLHWRDNTRRGQAHPIWIQEGLCSLIEDYNIEGGVLRPTASWRTNIAKRLDGIHKLMPIETLAQLTPAKFSGERPLANYAQARAVFLYVYQLGKLKEWYAYYVEHHKEDPTGVKALEAVLGEPIKKINANYRTWLKALPAVPESIPLGGPSLGVKVDSGGGEGPVVSSVVDLGSQRSALSAASKLNRGDVITSIDGRATRDIAELVRVLGEHKVGDEVEVEYRRFKKFGTIRITLVPRS